jgi:ParB family chromosome partitioning protein
LIEDLRIEQIDENPFNSRVVYKESEIRKLARSLTQHGLLEPIRVRKLVNRYQLVYGHTRLKAALLLRWKTIAAEVSSCTDEKMLELSFTENDSRHALSDYEKGLAFSRMNREFHKTYEEIGKSVGYSRSHICNYVRMTDLFDQSLFSSDKELASQLHKLSEHHARVLAQIHDQSSRRMALRMTVNDNLSVRDLQHIIQRLRGWFGNEVPSKHSLGQLPKTTDYRAIQDLLEQEIVLPLEGDFDSFADMHAYEEGFCSFNDVPPLDRLDGKEARRNDRQWFYSMAPRYSAKIFDQRIQVVGSMALTTFYISYSNKENKQDSIITRATVVCVRISGKWKILHEHGSRLEPRTKFARENISSISRSEKVQLSPLSRE